MQRHPSYFKLVEAPSEQANHPQARGGQDSHARPQVRPLSNLLQTTPQAQAEGVTRSSTLKA
jgi:hypothetical protein